jgi:hypothetical protein
MLHIKNDHEDIQRFIRVSGFLFFCFGIAAILFRIIQFFIFGDPPLEILVLRKEFLFLQGIPSLFVAIFFMLGSTVLYLRQASKLGIICLITYYFTYATLVLSSGAMWTYTLTAPVLASEAPELLTSPSSGIIQSVLLSLAIGQVGWLFLVLISFRTREIPRWALLVSIISSVLVLLMTPFVQTQLLRLIYNILLGAGPLGIGFVLWKDRSGKNLTSDSIDT